MLACNHWGSGTGAPTQQWACEVPLAKMQWVVATHDTMPTMAASEPPSRMLVGWAARSASNWLMCASSVAMHLALVPTEGRGFICGLWHSYGIACIFVGIAPVHPMGRVIVVLPNLQSNEISHAFFIEFN